MAPGGWGCTRQDPRDLGYRAELGRTAPLPNEWLPSHAHGGNFLTARGQVAGSCHWQLIFELWADHGLGDVKPTPRKDTMMFWANWVKIEKEGIYRAVDEDKYRGHVPG